MKRLNASDFSNVNPILVADSKIALKRFLQQKHGDDPIGKLATLQSFVEKFKNGNVRGFDVADQVALFEVLEEANNA